MERTFQGILSQFILLSAVALCCVAISTIMLTKDALLMSIIANLLSFFFVGSNFFVFKKIREDSSDSFYRKFYLSFGLRFLFVIAALVVALKAIKIHQIHFTVSFIFSYIFHSVIEIISINKILETDN
ncbi:ATP synthase subunit I [Fodinibius saliphilus]|uniref:ATP synthase subunit I n=1 Tax=Fodinibius saliphilus TaxID=1920650 RepID=UPI001485E45F|nr:ATP synthase subunit I [Fodinibius saliphilus]